MKIKCPFEPFEKASDYTERELSIHFHEVHEATEILSDYTSGLIFKIHEKIEDVDKWDAAIRGRSFTHLSPVDFRKELKSLLENKK